MSRRRKIRLAALAALSAATVGCGEADKQDERGGVSEARRDVRDPSTASRGVDDRIESNEEKVESDPRDAQAYKQLTQDYYSKAASLPVDENGKVPASGQDDLRKADESYRAFRELTAGKPDPSLALVAIQLYDPLALNKPEELQEAARLRAEVEDDAQSYLLLVRAATLAGDTRVAGLAGMKVVELAPRGQEKQAEQAVKETTADALTSRGQSAGGAQGGAPGAAPAPAPQP